MSITSVSTHLPVHSAPIPVGSARPNQIRNALIESIHALDQVRSFFCVNPNTDFTRNCTLSFSKVVQTILGFGSSTVFGELSEQLGNAPNIPTKSAFIISRQKILPDAFSFLFHKFMARFSHFKTFKGYRVFASDSSLLPIPDNLHDYNTMVRGKPGTNPYHQMGIEALYDVLNDTYVDFIVNDFNDHSERASFLSLVRRIKNPGSVIITADRFYGSLNNIAHLSRAGVHFVLRCKDIDSNGFASKYDLPDSTFDLSFHKTITCSRKDMTDPSRDYQFIHRKNFDFFRHDVDSVDIDFRLVRVDLGNGHFELLVTDLPREAFSPVDLSDLYRRRWKIETSFRRLKHLMGTLFFHSYKHDSVLQEVYAKFILYNFTAMLSACVSVSDSPKRRLKRFVNFSVAIALSRLFLLGKCDPAVLIMRLRQDLCYVRPDRSAPRNHRLVTQPAEAFNSRAV